MMHRSTVRDVPRRGVGLRMLICFGIVIFVGSTVGAVLDAPRSFEQQLARLMPENPEGYLLVGESLGARGEDEQAVFIAQQVLALGMGLADRRGETKLAASLCIALASFEPDPSVASRLWDYALMLDPDRRSAWRSFRDRRLSELAQIRADAARCVFAARFDDYQLALSLYEKAGVREEIRDAAQRGGLDGARMDRLISQMILDASESSCRGRVFITERGNGEVRRVVCPEHVRPVGTASDDENLRELVELEVLLLDQPHDPQMWSGWETNAYLRMLSPSRDPSAGEFLQYYRVDLSKASWRGGRWAPSP